jgi:hypothetical protein
MAATYTIENRGYETPCWIWQGTKRGGYGLKSNPAYSRTTKNAPKMIGAHVFYYEQKYGPAYPTDVLDHLCNVRACCNPEHLEPKSHAENIRRGKVPRMSEEKVELLRNDLSCGMMQKDAARRYGISQSTVSQIARNATWR